jgi:hypothetical protein
MSRIRLGNSGGLRIGSGGTAQVKRSFDQPATTTATLSLTGGRWLLSINGLSSSVQNALSSVSNFPMAVYARFSAYNPTKGKKTNSERIYHSQARGEIPARLNLTQYVRTGRLQNMDVTDFVNDMLFANRLRGLKVTSSGIQINLYGGAPGQTSTGNYYADFDIAIMVENPSGRRVSVVARTQSIRAMYINARAAAQAGTPVAPTAVVSGVVTI